MDDKEAIRTVLNRMVADGASEGEINSFVQKAGERLASSRAAAKPAAPPQEQPKPLGFGDFMLNQSGENVGGPDPGLGVLSSDQFTPQQRQHVANQGIATIAGMAAGGGLGALVEAIPAAGAAGVATRLGGAALSGAGAGATSEGTEAGLEGQPVLPAVEHGAKVGAVLGGVGGVAGEAAGGASKALRSDRWIGRFARANEAGTYETRRMQALAKGEEGIRQAADQAQSGITARNAEKMTAAGGEHAQDVQTALRAEPEQDASPIIDRLSALAKGNRTARTGAVRDSELEGAINETFDLLDVDPKTGKAMGEDILAARRTLEAKAQWGQPATKENRPYRDLYKAVTEGFKGPEVGPKTATQQALADADAKFSAQAGESQRLNDVLHGSDETNLSTGTSDTGAPEMRASKEKQAAARLARVGDNTVAGGVEQRQMAEVPKMDPTYDDLINVILDKKAQELTRPGLARGHSSLPHMLQFPGAPLIEQNARFLGARVIDPAAQLMSRAAPVAVATVPALAAPAMSSLHMTPEEALQEALYAQRRR